MLFNFAYTEVQYLVKTESHCRNVYRVFLKTGRMALASLCHWTAAYLSAFSVRYYNKGAI